MITEDQIKEALPPALRKSVNKTMVAEIQNILNDPEMLEHFRDNLLSYNSVLREGKFKVQQYVDAIRYVTFKMTGLTNREAYKKAFPERMNRHLAKGTSEKDIDSYITAYGKSKLVTLIMQQAAIPVWLANQDLYQRALAHQAHLMVNAKSEKVQSDAAAHLMNALRPPEVAKIELDVGVKESSAIAALREATMALVSQQRTMLQAGALNAKDVAEAPMVIEAADVD